MKINSVSNKNQSFGSFSPVQQNRIWAALMNHRDYDAYGVKKLMDKINKNSPHHDVVADFTYSYPILKAIPKNKNVKEILVSPGMFCKTLKSCMKKMNKKLIKANKIFDKTIAKAKKEPPSILDMPFENLPPIVQKGPPPIHMPDFSK